MKKETVTINVLTDKEIKEIAKSITENYFHKDDFSRSVLGNIRKAITDGIKEALTKQYGIE